MGSLDLLLDANLLLLWISGSIDVNIISRHKRLQQFETSDYVLLAQLMGQFRSLRTTPHVLTEVSNLASQVGEPLKTVLLEGLSRYIVTANELEVPSAEAAGRIEFASLGLTDSVLLNVCRSCFIVSTDFRLVNHLLKTGCGALNFTQVRDLAGIVSGVLPDS